jgi:hypothetical protein
MFFPTHRENDLEVIQGTTKVIEICIRDADGNPYDAKNEETLHFGVKVEANYPKYLISKHVSEITGGVAVVTLTPEDTKNIPYGRYKYDVSLESKDGFFNVIPYSSFIVCPGITGKE